jgi:protein-S-isoprenylcysteine O-methyltransferase Ste14
MKRVLTLFYGLIAYAGFLYAFLYLIGFTGNLEITNSIDGNPRVSIPRAIGVDVTLILLSVGAFSLMKKPPIGNRFEKLIPKPVQRSTAVLIASLGFLLATSQWEPVGGVVWMVTNETIRTIILFVYLFGWSTVFMSSFLLDHFSLFGLKHCWFYFKSKPSGTAPFPLAFFYRFVRQPLYVGILLALWATSTMTIAHLLLATTGSVYLFILMPVEGKGLYMNYRQNYVN